MVSGMVGGRGSVGCGVESGVVEMDVDGVVTGVQLEGRDAESKTIAVPEQASVIRVTKMGGGRRKHVPLLIHVPGRRIQGNELGGERRGLALVSGASVANVSSVDEGSETIFLEGMVAEIWSQDAVRGVA